jgi:hypothetical protein
MDARTAMTTAPFSDRLRKYYLEVAEVLRGEARVCSVLPNPSDVGGTREGVYAEFLTRHLPSRCNVRRGGFLFGSDGSESGQLDLFITTDIAPQYLLSTDGEAKSFAPVDGTLGVVEIKSKLDKKELFKALDGIAKIPPTDLLDANGKPKTIENCTDWPYKVVYASEGISVKTLGGHLANYYSEHPDVPVNRQANLIHVAGKYMIVREVPGLKVEGDREPIGNTGFVAITSEPDVAALVLVTNSIHRIAVAYAHIDHYYGEKLFNKVLKPDP